jgi:hypothetical protein
MICTRAAWNSGIHFLLRKTQVILNSDTALRAYPVVEMTSCMHKTFPFQWLLRFPGMRRRVVWWIGPKLAAYIFRAEEVLQFWKVQSKTLAPPDYTASLARRP